MPLTEFGVLISYGAEVHQVGELKFALDEGFIGSEGFAVLVLEVEAYPEPRSLAVSQLKQIMKKYGNSWKGC